MTYSTATNIAVKTGGAGSAADYRYPWPATTGRGVQVGLGGLWLLDGVLQLQPFMFTPDFARHVLAASGQDQPAWVGAPVDFMARLIAEHSAPLDTGFVLIQLALGIGFLLPRLVRPAIVGSLAWSAGIWWFGEGLGGLATGHASLVTGAPGAVLLYAVLALAAWPLQDHHGPRPTRAAVARWFPAAWAALWIGGAVVQLLEGQGATAALRNQIQDTDGLPAWLALAHRLAGPALSHSGTGPFIALVAVMALVGLGGLGGRTWRRAAAAVGAVAATAFWVLGQNVGELYSGQATDPNTGPLIVLMALALAGTTVRTTGPINTAQARRPDQTATAGGTNDQ